MPDGKEKGIEKAEVQLLHQIVIEDIRYAKDKQWKIIYYALLTLAAVIGFYLSTEHAPVLIFAWLWQKLILVSLILFVSYVAMYHLIDSQKCLCGYRMKLKAIEDGSNKEAIQAIEVKRDRKYFCRTLVLFFLMIVGLVLLIIYFLYDIWYLLILAILLGSLPGAYLLFKSFESARTGLGKGEDFRFTKYFWTLIFPFIILMMTSVFFVTWLLLIEKFSELEIGILIVFAGSACFLPCYTYHVYLVGKAIQKYTLPAQSSLIETVEMTISLVKHEKKLRAEKRKTFIDLLKKLLLELDALLDEASEEVEK